MANFPPAQSASTPRNRRILTRGLSGNMTTLPVTDANFVTGATTSGLSVLMRVALATDFDSVRILTPNMHSAALSGMTISLATSNGACGSNLVYLTPSQIVTYSGDGAFSNGVPSVVGDETRNTVFSATGGGYPVSTNGNGSSWTPVTWNGGGLAPSIPAKGPDFNVPAYTASDWMPISNIPRLDSGILPLLDVVVTYPAGSVATMFAFGTDSAKQFAFVAKETQSGGRMWRTWMAPGIFVPIANQGIFNSTTLVRPHSPAILIQYRSRKNAVQVMAVGDSIYEGVGQTIPYNNFSIQACLDLHTTANPVEFLSLARISQPSKSQYNHVAQIMNYVQPSILLSQSLSTNSMGIGVAIQSQTRASVGSVMVSTITPKPIPIICGITPCTTAGHNYGADDAIRIASNIETGALVVAEGGFYVDFDPTMATGGTVSGQLQLGTSFTADGIHWLDAGHTAAKVPVKTALAAAIAAL